MVGNAREAADGELYLEEQQRLIDEREQLQSQLDSFNSTNSDRSTNTPRIDPRVRHRVENRLREIDDRLESESFRIQKTRRDRYYYNTAEKNAAGEVTKWTEEGWSEQIWEWEGSGLQAPLVDPIDVACGLAAAKAIQGTSVKVLGSKLHGNSLRAAGPHDIYVIRDAKSGRILHFGETGRGFEVRGAEWVRKLKKEYGIDAIIEHVRTVDGKAAAKTLETRYVMTYEKICGTKPGFIDDAGNFIQIQKTRH